MCGPRRHRDLDGRIGLERQRASSASSHTHAETHTDADAIAPPDAYTSADPSAHTGADTYPGADTSANPERPADPAALSAARERAKLATRRHCRQPDPAARGRAAGRGFS